MSRAEKVALISAIDISVSPNEVQSLRDRLSREFSFDLGIVPFRVLISGIQPGTGSTTTKNLLNRVLGTQNFYDAGFYRRTLAQYWDTFSQSHGGRTQQNWKNFESQFRYNGVSTLQVVIHDTDPKQFSDASLAQLNEDQGRFSHENRIWDNLPDRFTFEEISNLNRGVWQGKLTAIIDLILREQLDTSDSPLFRFLLTINPFVAAKRVASREGTGFIRTLLANYTRKKRDWKVFEQLYGVTPRKFAQTPDLHIVDTSRHSPSEVVLEILEIVGKGVRQ